MVLFLHGCHNLYFRRNPVSDYIFFDYFAETMSPIVFFDLFWKTIAETYFIVAIIFCIINMMLLFKLWEPGLDSV